LWLPQIAAQADNKSLVDAEIGFWQDLYKVPMGRFELGVELENIKRYSFSGFGCGSRTRSPLPRPGTTSSAI
jgi:hypothetical protein